MELGSLWRARTFAALVVAACAIAAGCGGETVETGVVTPSLTVTPTRAALGSPVDMTVKFVVAPDAPAFAEDLRVFVHVMDQDGENLWRDDHDPSVPTTSWKPGQTIEYSRTSFVPVVPYNGPATVQIGLYSAKTGERLAMTGEHAGQRAYRVTAMELAPQSENVFLMFKDGWQPAEVSDQDSALEWQWTKQQATLVFSNPRKDAVLYLQYDGRPDLFSEPQHVRLLIGDAEVDAFDITSPNPTIRQTRIAAPTFGETDKVELRIDAGKSFVPSQLSNGKSGDNRELGIRVYHAYLRPAT